MLSCLSRPSLANAHIHLPDHRGCSPTTLPIRGPAAACCAAALSTAARSRSADAMVSLVTARLTRTGLFRGSAICCDRGRVAVIFLTLTTGISLSTSPNHNTSPKGRRPKAHRACDDCRDEHEQSPQCAPLSVLPVECFEIRTRRINRQPKMTSSERRKTTDPATIQPPITPTPMEHQMTMEPYSRSP